MLGGWLAGWRDRPSSWLLLLQYGLSHLLQETLLLLVQLAIELGVIDNQQSWQLCLAVGYLPLFATSVGLAVLGDSYGENVSRIGLIESDCVSISVCSATLIQGILLRQGWVRPPHEQHVGSDWVRIRYVWGRIAEWLRIENTFNLNKHST